MINSMIESLQPLYPSSVEEHLELMTEKRDLFKIEFEGINEIIYHPLVL